MSNAFAMTYEEQLKWLDKNYDYTNKVQQRGAMREQMYAELQPIDEAITKEIREKVGEKDLEKYYSLYEDYVSIGVLYWN